LSYRGNQGHRVPLRLFCTGPAWRQVVSV